MIAPTIPVALGSVGLTGTVRMVMQATPLDNPSSYLEYGFAGLVGLSFILMVWAVVNNKIVSQDTSKMLLEGAAREEKMLTLMTESAKREQALLDQSERLLDWLKATRDA